MITYEPFWNTLKEKNVTTYKLIHKLGISNGTVYRIRKGKNINTNTIDQLCKVLDCNVEDILIFTKEEQETDCL